MALLTQILSDVAALADSLSVDTTHSSTDNLGILDAILVSKTWGVNLVDSISTSDSLSKGFVRWVAPSESLAMTDQLNLSGQYARVKTDTMVVDDTIHTWMAANSVLQATFQGSADLQAVLLKKKEPGIPVGAPPRVVMLPKTPPAMTEHNVVVTPSRNREG